MRGRQFRTLFATWAVAAFALMATHASATTYRFEIVGSPDGGKAVLTDVNNLGQILGMPIDSLRSHVFVLHNGVYTTLQGPAGAIGTVAGGISDTGVITGAYFTTTINDPSWDVEQPGPSSGFVYDGVSYTTFVVPGALETVPRAISPDGRYVSGYASTASGVTGFLYDRATGVSQLIRHPDSRSTIAQGINSSYTLVGSDRFERDVDPYYGYGGFTYDIATGQHTSYFFEGHTSTAFRAIDDNGRLAGWLWDESLMTVGFVGTPEAFVIVRAPEADSTVIHGINNAGVLVGGASLGNETFGFIAIPVPEPQTWALMLAGIAAVGLARKRRAAH